MMRNALAHGTANLPVADVVAPPIRTRRSLRIAAAQAGPSAASAPHPPPWAPTMFAGGLILPGPP